MLDLQRDYIKAIHELGINAAIIKIEDINKILKYLFMFTLALVINEKVKSLKRSQHMRK